MTKSKRQRIREKTLKARIRTHNKRMAVWVGKIYWTKYKSGCEVYGQFYMSRLCPINGPVRNNGFEYKYPNRFRIRQYSATLKRSIPDLLQIPVSVAEQWKYSMPHLLDGMYYRARIPKRFLYEYKTPVMINHRSTYCSIFGGEITND